MAVGGIAWCFQCVGVTGFRMGGGCLLLIVMDTALFVDF